jgi:hypothetical protein
MTHLFVQLRALSSLRMHMQGVLTVLQMLTNVPHLDISECNSDPTFCCKF